MPKTSNPQFHFTETEPTPLLKDFETFTRFLEQNAFALGKASEYIPYKHLAALNEAMTNPNTETTPRMPQHFYPQLHLFYHFVVAGKLFRKIFRKNLGYLEVAERLATYRALSIAEKYFSLLETLWINCSWEELSKPQASLSTFFEINPFLQGLCDCEPDVTLFAKNRPELLQRTDFFLPSTIIQGFALFGWYQVERDEARFQRLFSSGLYPVAQITPSALGVALAKILMHHRPLEEWNIPFLRSEGMLSTLKEKKAKAPPDFVGLFRHLCAEDELRSILPREIPQFVKGNFVFKVNVSSKVWRTMALSNTHTLDDLHYLIQEAFEFDADHLYAFYMDNRWDSEERFESPNSDEGPRADEVKIGELGLATNQPFIYHFDFGDNWRFRVQLLEIKTGEPLLKKPQILEVHGKAPKQYPEADW